MTISQASQRLGISTHTLRNLERDGQISIKRDSRGHRYFTENDVQTIKDVRKEQSTEQSVIEKTIKVKKDKKLQPYSNSLKDLNKTIKKTNYAAIGAGSLVGLFILFLGLGVFPINNSLLTKSGETKSVGNAIKTNILGIKEENKTSSTTEKGKVLGQRDKETAYVFNVNVPTNLAKGLNVEGDAFFGGDISTPGLSFTGLGSIGGLSSIDETSSTTLESTLELTGDVTGTLGANTITEGIVDGDILSSTIEYDGTIDITGTLEIDGSELDPAYVDLLADIDADADDINTLEGVTTTAGGVIYTDGSTMKNTDAGTTGQVLLSNGAAAPTWGDVSDADTLDTLDSLQFLRSDTSDSYTSGTLSFSDDTFLDLSNIQHDDTAVQGIRLPQNDVLTAPASGEGYIAYDTDANKIYIYNGTAWTDVSGASTPLQEVYEAGSVALMSAGEGDIRFYNDGGDEILFLDESNGRVGIGNTAPSFKLDITGTLQATGVRVNSETVTDFSGTGITVTGGALTSTLGTSIVTSEIVNDTILEIDFDATNSPTDGLILSYDNATGGFTWIPNDGGSGASKWTDGGATTYLTSVTDDLAIGGDSLTSSVFAIDESEATFYVGYDNSSSPEFLFESADGDQGTFGFNNDDTFYISGANFQVGAGPGSYALDVAGDFNADSFYLADSQVTSTATEINVLDGITSSTTELNLLTGRTGALLDTSSSFSGDVSGVYNNLQIGSGTVGTTEVANDSILEIDLDVTNSPTDDYVLSYDQASGGFTWIAGGGGTIDGSGTGTYLTMWQDSDTITDSSIFETGGNIGIGTTAPNALLSVNSSGANVSINNPTDGQGLILQGVGGTTNGQLRIVANSSAWADNTTTAYFQIKTGVNNNATFMGGTYGADAPFDRLQFNSEYTTITNDSYTDTPVATAIFEVVNDTAARDILQVVGAGSQSGDYLQITSNGGAAGNILTVESTGDVGIGTTNPTDTLHVVGDILATGGVHIGVDTDTNTLIDDATNGSGSTTLYIGNESILASGDIGSSVQGYDANTSLIGQTIETGEITDDEILEVDLDSTNSPTDNYILSYDNASGGFTWIAESGGTVDGSGTGTYLTMWQDSDTLTNSSMFETGGNVGVGTTNPGYKLEVNGTGYFGSTLTLGNSSDITSFGSTTLGNRTYAEQNYITDDTTFTAAIDALDQALADVVGGGTGVWTDGGTTTYLTSLTDDLAIGGTGPTSELFFDTSASALTLNPFGTSSGNTGEIRFSELVANGTSYTGFKAPDSLGSNITYTLPSANGTADYVLTWQTGGDLEWKEVTGVGGAGDITAVGSMGSGDAFAGATADDDWLGLGAAAGRIEFDDQATDEVNILDANVGIGTTSPGAKLEISGTSSGIQQIVKSSDVASYIQFYSSATGSDGVNDGLTVGYNAGAFLLNRENSNLYLGTNGDNTNFVMTGSGDIGIGDFTTDARLEISANGGATDLFKLSSDDGNDGDLFVVTNSGDVGIGTTAPSQQVEIYMGALAINSGNSFAGSFIDGEDDALIYSTKYNFEGLGTSELGNLVLQPRTSAPSKIILANGNSSANARLVLDDSGNVVIGDSKFEAGSAKLAILDGNVGIGTTAPGVLLDVVETSSSTSGAISVTGGEGFHAELLLNADDKDNDADQWIMRSDAAGRLSFSDYSGASWVENLVIKTDGNVGIGTTNPGYKLEVNGTMQADDFYSGDGTQGASATTGGLTFKDGLYTTGTISSVDHLQNLAEVYAQDGSTGNAVELTASNGDIRFYNDGGNELLFLDESSGFVGIGTTAPQTALDVEGLITTPNYVGIGPSVSVDTDHGIAIGNGASVTTSNYGIGLGYQVSLSGAADSVGIGAETSITGGESIAIGQGASAGTFNVALGTDTTATGTHSIAIGESANASTYQRAVAIGRGSTVTANNQLVFSMDSGLNDIYFGTGVTAASPTDITINSSGGSGTNIAGGDLTLAGGKATGNASGGEIIFSTSDAGASGATLQTLSEKMRLSASGNVGIGTTNPTVALDVVGAINATTTVTADTSVSTPLLALSGTGTINGLDAVDSTTENTIEGLIFDSDAENITGAWEVQDNVTFAFGDEADFKFLYDETSDDRFELTDSGNNLFVDITDQGTTAEFAFNVDDFFIDDNGNIGVGTTNPGYGLEVSGTSYLTQAVTLGDNARIIMDEGFSSPVDYFDLTSKSRPSGAGWLSGFRFYVSENNGTLIEGANLKKVSGVSEAILTITGDITATDVINASGGFTGTTIDLTADADAIKFGNNNYEKIFYAEHSSPWDTLHIQSKSSPSGWKGRIDLETNYENGTLFTAMTIQANTDGTTANVGIGTTAPGYNLEVNGTMQADDYYSGDGTQGANTTTGGLTFKDGLYTSGSATTYDHLQNLAEVYAQDGSTGNAVELTASNGDIRFYNDGSAEMLFLDESNGYVSIGNTLPSQALDITGSLELEGTTTSTTGVIYKGSDRFIHNFQHPTGDSAVPTGNNTFVGLNAGNFTTGSTATSTSHGSYNTALGYNSLNSLTTGYHNTAVGYNAMDSNNTGIRNTAMGVNALQTNSSGNYNVAMGYGALNTNSSGGNNSGFGRNALYSNTTASRNAALGEAALFSITTGADNIGMGYEAGRYIANGSTANQTSGTSVYLGAKSKALADGDSNEIVIGYEAIGIGSNTAVLGNDSITKTVLKGSVGIGTTDPQTALHVTGTATVVGNIDLGLNNQVILDDDDNTYITATGDDRIGTYAGGTKITDVFNISGDVRHELRQTGTSNESYYVLRGASQGAVETEYGGFEVRDSGGDATAGMYFANIGGGANEGELFFRVRNNAGTTIEAMRLESSGNVGIGTTNPDDILDVVGTIDIATGNTYQINDTDVLSATTLGSAVVTSSLTTVGALNSGSITSGFGSIDIGSSNLDADGTITFAGISDGLVKAASGVLSAASEGTDYEGPLTFTNGITESSQTVKLGGALTENTTITQDSAETLTFTNAGTGNTTFNLSSTGDFDIQDNGTSVLFVKDDGNIGIGTTNPGNPLVVAGNIEASSGLITSTISGTNKLIQLTPAGGTGTEPMLWFRDSSGATAIRLDSGGESYIDSGNVGIGTTNPGYLLEVNGTMQADDYYSGDGTQGASATTGGLTFKDGLYTTGSATTYDHLQNLAEVYAQDGSTGNAVQLTAGNGDIRFYNDGGSEMLFLDESNGYVGIGTINPVDALHVNVGDSDDVALLQGSGDSGQGPGLLFKASHTNSDDSYKKAGIFFVDDNSGSARGDLRFAIENTADTSNVAISDTLMTILGGGNVGIGIVEPTAKLEVVGADYPVLRVVRDTSDTNQIRSTGAFMHETDAQMTAGFGVSMIYQAKDADGVTNEWGDIGFIRDGADGDGALFVRTNYSSTWYERMRIESAGNMGIGTTNPGYLLEVNGTMQADDFYSGDGTQGASTTTGGLTFKDGLYTSGSATTYDHLQNLGEVYAQDGSTGNAVQLTASNGDIRFYNDGSAEMLFLDESSGYIGIGTTAPTILLDVMGDMRLDEKLYDENNSAGSSGQILTATTTGTQWGTPATTQVIPSFSVHRNGSGVSINNNTDTVVDWTTEAFDTNNDFDLTTERFTPTVPGKYLLTGSASYSSGIGPNIYAYVYILKNGASIARDVMRSGTSDVASRPISVVVDADGDDYFELQVKHVNGASATLSGARDDTHFTGSRIDGGNGLWTLNSPDINYTAGNVGIGTTNPGQELEVSGDLQATNYYSGDGTQGATSTVSGLVYKDGLYTSGAITGFDNYSSWTMQDGDSSTYTVTSGDTMQIAEGTGIDVDFTGDDVLTVTASLGTSIAGSEVDNDTLDYVDFEDTMDLDANLILNQTTYTWTQNFTGTTTTGWTYNADSLTTGTGQLMSFDALTEGTGLSLTSTSTALTTGGLMSLDWSPGSSTTATGDLFSINIGANGSVDNLFAIYDNTSDVFTVGESQITSAVPHSFTAAGDVSMAYDLIMSNQTSSKIESYGPFEIEVGQSFENNDLTITTYGTGAMVVAATGGSEFTRSGNTVATFDRTTSDGTIISLKQAGTEEGTISVSGTTVSYNAFTGSHYAWSLDDNIGRGMLVSLTDENKHLHGREESEILYGVDVTAIENDSKVMGAFLAKQEGNRPTSIDNPLLVMAVGNADLWIVDTGANVESGDYLISSSTPGHARMDGPSFETSFIIARAAENVDWSSVDTYVEGTDIKHKKISVFFESFVIDRSVMLADVNEIQNEVALIKDLLGLNVETGESTSSETLTGLSGLIETMTGIYNDFVELTEALGMTKTEDENGNDVLAVGSDLTVTGNTSLSDLTVTGDIMAGLIKIDSLENSIGITGAECGNNETLCETQTLHIQKSLAGNVDILDGSLIIEPNGTVTISDQVVAGMFTTKEDEEAPTSGQVTIAEGSSETEVNTQALSKTENVLILATPRKIPVAVSTEITDTDTFVIKLADSQTQDVEIDWLIVGRE